jgi:hypothetical protein
MEHFDRLHTVSGLRSHSRWTIKTRRSRGHGCIWCRTYLGIRARPMDRPIPTKRKVRPKRVRFWARLRSFLRRLRRHLDGLLWGRGGTG